MIFFFFVNFCLEEQITQFGSSTNCNLLYGITKSLQKTNPLSYCELLRYFSNSHSEFTCGDIQLLRYYKMTKIWTPLSPCFHLFDFGKPFLLRTFNALHQPPPTLYKNSKSCHFYIVS